MLKHMLKHLIVLEATRFKKEMGKDTPRWQEKLIRYEKAGGYFIHFSTLPKMGLFIRNKYGTPIGFYVYPLNKEEMRDFAVDRPYALIVKPKPEARILDLRSYSDEDLSSDIQKLIGLKYSKARIKTASEKAKNQTPGGRIWNITRVLSGADKADTFLKKVGKVAGLPKKAGGPTGTWTMLLRKLGYNGAVDNGDGIIHPSEPSQAVFFDTTKLDLVELIDKSNGKAGTVRRLFRINAQKRDLSGKDYAGLNIQNSIFDGSNLSGANFTDSGLAEASFEGATLEGANFQKAELVEANFRKANLAGADLSGANARYADFNHAKLAGTVLNGADLFGAGFLSADLSNTDLSGVSLRKCAYNQHTKFPKGFDPAGAGMQISF